MCYMFERLVYPTYSSELRLVAKDAVQPDSVKGFLRTPLVSSYPITEHMRLRRKHQLGANLTPCTLSKFRSYRYVTRTNVSFFDPSPNLVVRSKNGTFVRLT